jgi:hypothetical protein
LDSTRVIEIVKYECWWLYRIFLRVVLSQPLAAMQGAPAPSQPPAAAAAAAQKCGEAASLKKPRGCEAKVNFI